MVLLIRFAPFFLSQIICNAAVHIKWHNVICIFIYYYILFIIFVINKQITKQSIIKTSLYVLRGKMAFNGEAQCFGKPLIHYEDRQEL